MTKLTGETLNIEEENIQKIKELFPEVNTDGKIDFDKLKQLLGDYVEDSDERYNFTWNGKGEALRISQTPSMGTLRPAPEESKNWDETENLYIEGDNLEVLKLLQKSYFNKVDVIYIDPPYNTGNDIIYKNDFHDSLEYYKTFTNQINVDGFKLSTNQEYNGRYHTNWLNMMYPRLRLAKNLLTDDGIIVMAIDDYEFDNLKKIADEIFGQNNFIGSVVVRSNPQGRGKKNIDPVHEYNFIYAKNISKIKNLEIKRDDKDLKFNYLIRSGTNSRKFERPYRFYPMLIKNGEVECITKEEYLGIYNGTKFNEEYLKKLEVNYKRKGFKVVFPIAQDGEEKVWQREFDRVMKECHSYIYENGQIKTPPFKYRTPQSLWLDEKYSNSGSGTNILINLFKGLKPFDFPKSFRTVKDFISLVNKKDMLVLDFFAGSSTTAHAVMDLNIDDGGQRKFIMVQLPESLENTYESANKDRKKELKKVIDYLKNNDKSLTLGEIGKERIRRAGEQIKNDNKNNQMLDIGFKTFKLDSSNIKEWNPGRYDDVQLAIEDSLSPYVEGRTEKDVVYEMILKMGLDLTYPVKEYKVNGQTVYSVGYGFLMISLADEINLDIAEKMIEIKDKYEPEEFRVIFRDEGFRNDTDKTNIKETLRSAGLAEEAFITL